MPSSALALQIVWHAQSPLPEARAGLLYAVVDGRLLIAGGARWNEDRKLWTSRCDFFDLRGHVESRA